MTYVTLEEYERTRKRLEAEFTKRLAAQGKVIVDSDVLRMALMTDREMDEFSKSATADEWQAACEKFDRLRAALAPPVEGE